MNRKAALLKKFGRSLRAENGSAFAQAYLAAELVRMAVHEKHSKQELMDAIRETAIDLFGQFGGSPMEEGCASLYLRLLGGIVILY